MAPNRYFVCADFKSADGTICDLDFWVESEEDGSLTLRSTTLHKVSGEERYTWTEKDGVWARQHLDGTPFGAEHPSGEEHPTGGEHPTEKEHPSEHPEHPTGG